MKNPILGGVEILPQAGSINEQITPLVSRTLARLSNGTGVPLVRWSKDTGTISSSESWIPAGLDAIDYTVPLVFYSGLVKSVNSASSTVTIKGRVRVDEAPYAEGYNPATGAYTGRLATTSNSTQAADGSYTTVLTITGTIPSGYTYFTFRYRPIYTVFVTSPPTLDQDTYGAVYGWSVAWEEI